MSYTCSCILQLFSYICNHTKEYNNMITVNGCYWQATEKKKETGCCLKIGRSCPKISWVLPQYYNTWTISGACSPAPPPPPLYAHWHNTHCTHEREHNAQIFFHLVQKFVQYKAHCITSSISSKVTLHELNNTINVSYIKLFKMKVVLIYVP